MAGDNISTLAQSPLPANLSRRQAIMLFHVGPLLDTIVLIFLVTVVLTGHTAWWVTLPEPHWLYTSVVYLWVLLAGIYWLTTRLARLHGMAGHPFTFRTAAGLWKTSHRPVACLIAVMTTAEWLTWLLLAMLAADTIRYYQIWAATDGDVSWWVPMSLLVAALLGSWMWSVRFRRPYLGSLGRDHPRYQYHKSWPMVAAVLAAIVIVSYLVAEFPHPPRHRIGLAVVLGNHVLANDKPGCVLRGRLRAAIWLYRHGLVRYIMVSGRAKYGRFNPRKNEPLAMAIYCLEHHVPDHVLIIDYDGINTRYTVYHAVEWMHKHRIKHVVGVSSIYHLPRIYFAFRQLGVKAYTVASIKREWREINPWGLFRECIAVPVYGIDAHYHKPAGGLNGNWNWQQ
jgi:vancomycin permeability regulator SanA